MKVKYKFYKKVVILIISEIFMLNIKGCGYNSKLSDTHKAETNLKKGVTITLLLPREEPKAQQEVTKAIEEKLSKDGLNFKLDFTYVPIDDYYDKVMIAVASGESYDLAMITSSNISDFVSKKSFLPLDSALQNYGKEIIKNTPANVFKDVTIDGKIYGIPRVMPTSELKNFVQIRGDLRKKYGLPEIKTVNDMDEYLETIAKNESDMVPYFHDVGRFLAREYGDVDFLGGDFLSSPIYIDPADPQLKVKNTYESDIFKNVMAKMREWNAKGYLSFDTSKIPDSEYALNTGKIAATWSYVNKETERIDAFKALTPDGELENVYLYPEKPKYMFTAADNILSVPSSSMHINEAVALVNWIRSSQENYDLFTYGIKDVNYKLDGNSISYDGIKPEHSYMPPSWAWNDIKYARFSKYISPEYVETLKNWDKDSIPSPTLGFVPDFSPVKAETTEINALILEYVPRLYNSKSDWNSNMDKFRNKLNDAGIDDVIKEIQRQFDNYRAKNK